MLTADYCVSLQSGWGTLAQLEVYAVPHGVVCNADFPFCVSLCQLVIDYKLPTPSALMTFFC